MVTMTGSEVAAFADSVRGVLGKLWPGARAAETGAVGEVWDAAVAHGWFELGPQRALAAALAAVRECGRVACPLPIVDGYVAGAILGDDATPPGRAGRVLVALDGGTDTVRYAEAGTAATHLLALPAPGGTARLRPILAARPTPGLAAPAWCELTLGPQTSTVEVDASGVDDALVLMRLGLATRALAAAERAHQLAVEHAKLRRQFGRPVGAFGAVAGRIARCQIELSAGNLLIADAVRRCESGAGDWRLAAEIATHHARAAAPRVQLGAHHTLAATGYFEEHDAPWLFRRVHADVTRLAEFPRAAGTVADVLVESTAGLPTVSTVDEMRGRLRELLSGYRGGERTGEALDDDPELVRLLAEHGYLELGPAGQLVLQEEVGYRRLPANAALAATTMLGNAIDRHGTAEQRAAFLPLIRQGRLRFCLGYSEPEAGSDLASLRTRARRDPDSPGWIIDGQKVWTTGAHLANYVWLATRTDPEASPPHAGITVFLVPMDTPGITLTRHRALSGETSCTVTYDGVRVPDTARVGAVNGGWAVITDALSGERVVMAGIAAALHRQLDDLVAAARPDPVAVLGPRGGAARERLAGLAVRVQATRALVVAAGEAIERGAGGRLEAPMAAVLAGELAEDFGEAVLEMLGPEAALSGVFEYGLRLSIMYVVGGGTNDVQCGLIARGLGLPRPA
ncbi:acyl-CoA dehydrogenase [Rugosimonospora acidiphila]|uniref:Acyl-CoA dehydrogenase n=1 Tax=Rugosimonospora acidiphila TaxID=556531 RepID=A0ABP9SUT3_9ACTN